MRNVKVNTVALKSHPHLNEAWVQQAIAEDPSILSLGDVVLKDRERVQPGTGRLDLLLQDAESTKRYEVEIQLGATDEKHIVRTIEYWDVERKRYPQYEHVAVIVAEDITSRFFNVIGLFNGFIPLIALKMSAIETSEGIGLYFTKVLDVMPLGLVEEDEEVRETTDRAYWERKAGPKLLALADRILALCKAFEPSLEPKYNKFYIGCASDGVANNFVVCQPRKSWMKLAIRLQKSDELTARLEDSGLDLLDYETRWGRYRFKVDESAIKLHEPLLSELLKMAYEESL